MGIEIPCHINSFGLQFGSNPFLGEASLLPQTAEVGPYTIILFYLLAYICPPSVKKCGNPHILPWLYRRYDVQLCGITHKKTVWVQMFPQYVYSTAHDIFDRGCDMENPMSESLENIIIRTPIDFPERCQLAYTDIIIAGFDVGIEIPCHVNPFHLKSGGGLFLGETGLLPQTAEVGAYTIVLLYLLIHLSSSINWNVWNSTLFTWLYV